MQSVCSFSVEAEIRLNNDSYMLAKQTTSLRYVLGRQLLYATQPLSRALESQCFSRSK